MEILPVIFTVVLIISTIVLAVVGVQLFLVLIEVRRMVRKLNDTLDAMDERMQNIFGPLRNLGGMAQGVSAGFKVFEAFVGWLQKNSKEK